MLVAREQRVQTKNLRGWCKFRVPTRSLGSRFCGASQRSIALLFWATTTCWLTQVALQQTFVMVQGKIMKHSGRNQSNIAYKNRNWINFWKIVPTAKFVSFLPIILLKFITGNPINVMHDPQMNVGWQYFEWRIQDHDGGPKLVWTICVLRCCRHLFPYRNCKLIGNNFKKYLSCPYILLYCTSCFHETSPHVAWPI